MYKLILGDTPEELKKIDDESVELVVTSPPYVGAPKLWGEFWASANFEVAHSWLDTIWDECIRVLKPGCKLTVNVGNGGDGLYVNNSWRIQQWATSRKIACLREIIWLQGSETGGNNATAWGSWRNPAEPRFRDAHEYILIFRKDGKRYTPTTDKIIDKDEFLQNINAEWRLQSESAKSIGHPAPFPITIPLRLITMLTFEGETVLDPFMGSGTTAVAAEMLGRNSIGIDHLQKNIDLAHDRINKVQASRGKEARRLSPTLSVPSLFA